MADFVAKSTIKSAVRTLATPIATLAGIRTVIDAIVTNNPFSCTSYVSGGVTLDPVQISKEYYSGKVVFEDNTGKQVGYISINAATLAGFNTCVSTIMADSALAAAMGTGAAGSHDSSEDKGSVTIKCHDANGELYNVTLNREQMTVSSYETDSILTTIETYADTVPALA